MSLSYKMFKSLLKDFEYFENKPHIGVGVSGGPDSMALVYLLHKWVKNKNGKLTRRVDRPDILSVSSSGAFLTEWKV